jgi:hypothetical protein
LVNVGTGDVGWLLAGSAGSPIDKVGTADQPGAGARCRGEDLVGCGFVLGVSFVPLFVTGVGAVMTVSLAVNPDKREVR